MKEKKNIAQSSAHGINNRQIRSNHFMKNKIPLISDKKIPLHNAFGITISDYRPASESRPNLWGYTSARNHSSLNAQRTSPLSSHYNRPQSFLRKYLYRKERHSFVPRIDISSSKDEPGTRTGDFRIKRTKKNMLLGLEEESSGGENGWLDRDILNFSNNSKNIYQMSPAELEESIQLKKKFLEVLNNKIRSARAPYKSHNPI